MAKPQVEKSAIFKLRASLPYGSILKICERLNVPRAKVHRVLRGEVYDSQIIEEAIKIAEKEIEAIRKSEERINQLINK